MTLGELKIESLRLMHINEDEDISPEDIPSLLGTDTYGTFLVNMIGAINRCFLDLENRGVLSSKCFQLRCDDGEICSFGRNIRFELLELIEDFLAVDRLVYENVGGKYDGKAPYRIEGESLILPVFDGEKEEYRLYYHPRISRLSADESDSTVIDIPPYIAEYIPYFVKSELYGHIDEPAEAAEAYNIYESGVTSVIRSTSAITRVENKYSQL